ncbi:hypothetical protein Q3G72_011244 [Acer saccharum]|nr:hypothetical protein Q3G72_011244 [Acer saccharum]
MRHLFDKLREDHHLKHGGRMQLGLFLKEGAPEWPRILIKYLPRYVSKHVYDLRSNTRVFTSTQHGINTL